MKPESDAQHKFREAAREEERARNREEFYSATEPILEELKKSGADVTSFGKFGRMHVQTIVVTPLVVQVLLKWLDRTHDDRVIDVLVTYLAHSKRQFDGGPLIRAFERVQSELTRWAIGNTLSKGKATGIEDWLAGAVLQSRFGRSREMLFLAVARLLPRETARGILRSALDEFPLHAAPGLARVGNEKDIGLLEARAKGEPTWIRKACESAIRRIRKRSEKAQ